jgi:hypothetical protein
MSGFILENRWVSWFSQWFSSFMTFLRGFFTKTGSGVVIEQHLHNIDIGEAGYRHCEPRCAQCDKCPV